MYSEHSYRCALGRELADVDSVNVRVGFLVFSIGGKMILVHQFTQPKPTAWLPCVLIRQAAFVDRQGIVMVPRWWADKNNFVVEK